MSTALCGIFVLLTALLDVYVSAATGTTLSNEHVYGDVTLNGSIGHVLVESTTVTGTLTIDDVRTNLSAITIRNSHVWRIRILGTTFSGALRIHETTLGNASAVNTTLTMAPLVDIRVPFDASSNASLQHVQLFSACPLVLHREPCCTLQGIVWAADRRGPLDILNITSNFTSLGSGFTSCDQGTRVLSLGTAGGSVVARNVSVSETGIRGMQGQNAGSVAVASSIMAGRSIIFEGMSVGGAFALLRVSDASRAAIDVADLSGSPCDAVACISGVGLASLRLRRVHWELAGATAGAFFEGSVWPSGSITLEDVHIDGRPMIDTSEDAVANLTMHRVYGASQPPSNVTDDRVGSELVRTGRVEVGVIRDSVFVMDPQSVGSVLSAVSIGTLALVHNTFNGTRIVAVGVADNYTITSECTVVNGYRLSSPTFAQFLPPGVSFHDAGCVQGLPSPQATPLSAVPDRPVVFVDGTTGDFELRDCANVNTSNFEIANPQRVTIADCSVSGTVTLSGNLSLAQLNVTSASLQGGLVLNETVLPHAATAPVFNVNLVNSTVSSDLFGAVRFVGGAPGVALRLTAIDSLIQISCRADCIPLAAAAVEFHHYRANTSSIELNGARIVADADATAVVYGLRVQTSLAAVSVAPSVDTLSCDTADVSLALSANNSEFHVTAGDGAALEATCVSANPWTFASSVLRATRPASDLRGFPFRQLPRCSALWIHAPRAQVGLQTSTSMHLAGSFSCVKAVEISASQLLAFHASHVTVDTASTAMSVGTATFTYIGTPPTATRGLQVSMDHVIRIPATMVPLRIPCCTRRGVVSFSNMAALQLAESWDLFLGPASNVSLTNVSVGVPLRGDPPTVRVAMDDMETGAPCEDSHASVSVVDSMFTNAVLSVASPCGDTELVVHRTNVSVDKVQSAFVSPLAVSNSNLSVIGSSISVIERAFNHDAIGQRGGGTTVIQNSTIHAGGVIKRNTAVASTTLSCVSLNGAMIYNTEPFLPTGAAVSCDSNVLPPPSPTPAAQDFAGSLSQVGLTSTGDVVVQDASSVALTDCVIGGQLVLTGTVVPGCHVHLLRCTIAGGVRVVGSLAPQCHVTIEHSNITGLPSAVHVEENALQARIDVVDTIATVADVCTGPPPCDLAKIGFVSIGGWTNHTALTVRGCSINLTAPVWPRFHIGLLAPAAVFDMVHSNNVSVTVLSSTLDVSSHQSMLLHVSAAASDLVSISVAQSTSITVHERSGGLNVCVANVQSLQGWFSFEVIDSTIAIMAKDGPGLVVAIAHGVNGTRDVNVTVQRSTIGVASAAVKAVDLVSVGSPLPVANCSECRFPTATAHIVVERSELDRVGNIVAGEVQQAFVRVRDSVMHGVAMDNSNVAEFPGNGPFVLKRLQSTVDVSNVVFVGTRPVELRSPGTLRLSNVSASATVTVQAASITAEEVNVNTAASVSVILDGGLLLPTVALNNFHINVSARGSNAAPAMLLQLPQTRAVTLSNVSAIAPSLLQVHASGIDASRNVTLLCCQLNGVRVTSPAVLWPSAIIGACDWTVAPPTTTAEVTTAAPTPAPFATLPPPTPGPTPLNSPTPTTTAVPLTSTTTTTTATTTTAAATMEPATTSTVSPATTLLTSTVTASVQTSTSPLLTTTTGPDATAFASTTTSAAATSTTAVASSSPWGTSQSPPTTGPPAVAALRVAGLRQPPEEWVAGALASVTDVEGIHFVSSQVAANGDLWVVVTVPGIANSTFMAAVSQQAALLGVTDIQPGSAPPDDTSAAVGPSGPAPTADDDDGGAVIIAVAAAAAVVVGIAAAAGAYVVLQRKPLGASPHEPLQDELLVMPSNSV